MRGEKKGREWEKDKEYWYNRKKYDNDIEDSYSEWDKNKPKVMSKE